MIEDNKKPPLSKSNIIKASEIGQYKFCSISWKLQKSGFKPNSPSLKKGKKIHESHGFVIEHIENMLTKSKILTLLGYFILFIASFIILFEVIF